MRPQRTSLWRFLSDIVYGIDAGHAIRHGLPPRPPRAAAPTVRDEKPRSMPPTTVRGVAPQLPMPLWTWQSATPPSRN